MIVKEIIDEKLLTLSEVKEILEGILKLRKEDGEEEQVYEFRKALGHASLFSKISSTESRDLVNRLTSDIGISLETSIRISDLLPLSNDEIRAIFSKEKCTLKEEDIKRILDIIKNYA